MDNFVLKGRSGQFEFGYLTYPSERNQWVTRDRESGKIYTVMANTMSAAFQQAGHQDDDLNYQGEWV